jgi:putative SOS response-associated peptidase YedK
MCGRYALFGIDELKKEFPFKDQTNIKPNYNAAPTQTMPVVTENGIELMRWGLIPSWAKDEKIGNKLINARSESVFEKPVWKRIIMTKKCLIPANGFYEWKKITDSKQPFYIHPTDQSLFMFAGVWDSWKHEGKEWHTYSILTTKPNKEMEEIHDRMPVILYREDWHQWLEADRIEDIKPLLVQYGDGELELFEVSKDVNIVKTNSEKLILPVNSQ